MRGIVLSLLGTYAYIPGIYWFIIYQRLYWYIRLYTWYMCIHTHIYLVYGISCYPCYSISHAMSYGCMWHAQAMNAWAFCTRYDHKPWLASLIWGCLSISRYILGSTQYGRLSAFQGQFHIPEKTRAYEVIWGHMRALLFCNMRDFRAVVCVLFCNMRDFRAVFLPNRHHF